MPEGMIGFSAVPTPAHWDDKMESVTLMCSISQVGGEGSVMAMKEMPTPEARAHAAAIIRACEIVEKETPLAK